LAGTEADSKSVAKGFTKVEAENTELAVGDEAELIEKNGSPRATLSQTEPAIAI